MLRQYVVIAGNIGLGKTTLVRYISQAVPGAVGFIEERSEDLASYYANPHRFAFRNQVEYTVQYLKQAVDIARSEATLVVQDRSIYDTHMVFSRLHLEHRTISGAEYEILQRAYALANRLVQPDLMVLLDASPEFAHHRMMRRGLTEERNVHLKYLATLRAAYLAWFATLDGHRRLFIESEGRSVSSLCAQVVSALESQV
jgi:deoxyadenosine/deoxycytidine kinase